MRTSKNKILKKNQLSKLVNRFSKNFVVEEIERNLRNNQTTNLLTNDINDNPFIKNALISTEVINNVGNSITKNGLSSNPLVVRKKKDFYEIVLGRKRLLASKKIGIPQVPVIIINISDEEMLLMLLADNREQKEGNVIEMAMILQELNKTYGYDQKTLAEIAHQSRSQITNILRILNLPTHIINDIAIGKLSYGHARAIISLPEDTIEQLTKKIYQDKLSVREVEYLAKKKHKNGNKNNSVLLLNKFTSTLEIKDKSVTVNFDNNKERDEFLKEIHK